MLKKDYDVGVFYIGDMREAAEAVKTEREQLSDIRHFQCTPVIVSIAARRLTTEEECEGALSLACRALTEEMYC